MTLLLACLLLQDGEAELRERFARTFKEKDLEKRIEALRFLTGAKEPKSVALAVGALKDPSLKVRKAAAEVLGTAGDVEAAGIRPLCGVLTSPKEDPDLRLTAARSLVAAPYRAEAIEAMLKTLSEGETATTNFGVEVLKLLQAATLQDFGEGKPALAKAKAWWGLNRTKVGREDEVKLAARKKAG